MNFSQELIDYYSTLDVTIILYPENITKKLISLDELYEFISKEEQFWQIHNISTASRVYEHIRRAYGYIDMALNNNDKSNIDNAINTLKNPNLVFSETTVMQYIKGLVEENIDVGIGAYDFLINRASLRDINNRDYLTGVIYAFNWEKKDKEINSYEKSQLDNFTRIKNEATDLINLLKGELKEAQTKSKITYSGIEKKLNESNQKITEEHNNLINDLKDSSNKAIEDLSMLYDKKNEEFEYLKLVFKDQMRLQEPAAYWKELETRYKIKGIIWVCLSVLITLVLGAFLTFILYTMPDVLKLVDTGSYLSGIRGIIILAIIVAAALYLLKLFVKLATSSFHLSRDAKERYQLTHIYLALVYKNTIAEKERFIIIESLFSRADTGLLKGDSSPAFPLSGLSQIKDLLSNK